MKHIPEKVSSVQSSELIQIYPKEHSGKAKKKEKDGKKPVILIVRKMMSKRRLNI